MVRPGPAGIVWVFEKHQQLRHRHAPSFIRHVLDTFWQGTLSASEAAEQLGLSRSRLYGLATAYLCARAQKQGAHWTPGGSGGDPLRPLAPAGLGTPAQATELRSALPLQLRRFRGPPAPLL